MGPQVEYATTSDGRRIATIAFGEGPPLLIAATPPWSHVVQEFAIPAMRAWLEALAEQAHVIRYDCRSTGLSEREPLDFAVESQAQDLAAVADHHGLRRFAIWGAIGGSPAAIMYAARNPGRVSHLMLWAGYASGAMGFGRPEVRGLGALMRQNWELYSDTYAQAAFGWPDAATAEQYARMMRAAISHEGMIAAAEVMARLDVTAEARAIRVPTLVFARRDARFGGVDEARELTTLIPTARLVILEGASPAPFLGDSDMVVEAVREFMADDRQAREARAPAVALTGREDQVLRLLAVGRSGREIAGELGISLATAQRHIANVYAKLGARGRVEAVAYAFEHGMVARSGG